MTPEERELANKIRKIAESARRIDGILKDASESKKRIEKLVADHKRKLSEQPCPQIIKQIEDVLTNHVYEDDGA